MAARWTLAREIARLKPIREFEKSGQGGDDDSFIRENIVRGFASRGAAGGSSSRTRSEGRRLQAAGPNQMGSRHAGGQPASRAFRRPPASRVSTACSSDGSPAII